MVECHTCQVFGLGDVVRKLRKQRNLTLKDLSRRAKVNIGTLSGIERNEGNPTNETLQKIADTLGVDVADLWAPMVARAQEVASVDPHELVTDDELAFLEDFRRLPRSVQKSLRTIAAGYEPRTEHADDGDGHEDDARVRRGRE